MRGTVRGTQPVLARVHAMCAAGDVLGSTSCDCGAQLRQAIAQIAREGKGVLVYLQQEGKGGANLLRCARLAPEERKEGEQKRSTGAFRDYGLGAQILNDLGVRKLKLLTNNPKKLVGLAGYGLEVVERVAIEAGARRESRAYLRRKRDELGHLIGVAARPGRRRKPGAR